MNKNDFIFTKRRKQEVLDTIAELEYNLSRAYALVTIEICPMDEVGNAASINGSYPPWMPGNMQAAFDGLWEKVNYAQQQLHALRHMAKNTKTTEINEE